MAYGADTSLATVDMHNIGAPGGGSDGTYIRTFLTDSTGKLWVLAGAPAVASPNLATSQVTATTSAGTLAASRPTRTSVLVLNTDATNTVYVGPATVTTGNGFPLKPGQSVVLYTTALIQVIAAAGTPVVAVADEYN